MRRIVENLVALQRLHSQSEPLSPENQRDVSRLRAQVPEPILAHFDRLIARGKKGVAMAVNGACGECHLRLPSGTIAALASSNEIHLCDNCGRYLYVPAGESAGPTQSPSAAKGRVKARTRRIRPNASVRAA